MDDGINMCVTCDQGGGRVPHVCFVHFIASVQ